MRFPAVGAGAIGSYICHALLSQCWKRATTTRGEVKMNTFGAAVWEGGIRDGKGAISTKSGALDKYPYGFASRFEGKPGTNPEELIGAAHAGCFTMALSLILGEAQLTAEHMETNQGRSHPGEGRGRLRHYCRSPDPQHQNHLGRQARSLIDLESA